MAHTGQIQSNGNNMSKEINIDECEVVDEKLNMKEKQINIENADKREDAQRKMAWFALFGMLLYPVSVVSASCFGLDHAATVLGDIAPTYFVSVAAIVAAFYGAQAYHTAKTTSKPSDGS
jgi:hypothetical protein